jgi:hypothetical protein
VQCTQVQTISIRRRCLQEQNAEVDHALVMFTEAE